ncbi:hypothetical protein [Achromobacter sp. Bel]|uniref:TPR end-of-group domain-containing protein n=1 Tax=Achromobacter sp. Bel TaxID=2727415 RepID=UPI00145E475D|nr:hypothetical protein [Achromobacter sp. Bel]NMK45506.1 hypothetical protein [Achromobacter sp. Bel]
MSGVVPESDAAAQVPVDHPLKPEGKPAENRPQQPAGRKSWLDTAWGRLVRWFLTYGLPMYLIVLALIYMGVHGLFGEKPSSSVGSASRAESSVGYTGQYFLFRREGYDQQVPPMTAPQSLPTQAPMADTTAIAIAKFAVDSTKDRIDALRESYEKLFGVIATLGALLAFLGFKGVESFMTARAKAQETVEKASAAVASAQDAKIQAETAIERLRVFLEEDYPRDNRSEVNVVHGIVMREIAEIYGKLSEAQGNDKQCPEYIDALEQSLRYLQKVPYGADGIDPKIACRALVSIGNVKRRLGDIRGALEACQMVLDKYGKDDDSAHYNLACYSCLLAAEATKNHRHSTAMGHGSTAIAGLKRSIELDPRCREAARNDPDFAWFRERGDPAFLQLLQVGSVA